MFNCDTYETCPKGITITKKIVHKNKYIKFLFMGCWGVFCSNELIKNSQYGGNNRQSRNTGNHPGRG
jgi:hypothetical protein